MAQIVPGTNANEQLGLHAPDNFEITLYADEQLANDIYSLTVDSLGRVVVSSRGYVRILLDTDADGVADTAQQFADGPKSGAQGLHFVDRDLLCTGDDGLLRYTNRDADDRADGPPELLLKAEAGGEHNIHAIRQGPDGYYYLMAGNQSGITSDYAALPSSPVKKPLAGTLLRITPDFRQTEILAHGFRNAYDFAFNPLGDIFTYDSDGERDVSLPWYRPTRVFHVLPGSHAGWFSRHWKRPDYFFDMPPVVGAFGRGSPTGVVCYRHHKFPKEYHGALFVLDWTYGRVMALPLTPDGSIYKSEPEPFITAIGQHGFAPTDAAVAPDGSLYISVGGRGTRGGVYRIRYKDPQLPATASDDLTRCLAAPQPLSSWSRKQWEPLAQTLGKQKLTQAALNADRPTAERIRAVEILTEKMGGLDTKTAHQLITENTPTISARVAWSLGRFPTTPETLGLLMQLIRRTDPLTQRFVLEALVGQPSQLTDIYGRQIAHLLNHEDLYVRQTAGRAFVNLSKAMYIRGINANTFSAWGTILSDKNLTRENLHTVSQLLTLDVLQKYKLSSIRLAQIILGDVGPANETVPVFESYTPRKPISSDNKLLANSALAIFLQDFPTGDKLIDHEYGRLIAMIAPDDPQFFNLVLNQITDSSNPVEDIHHLIILARLPVERTLGQRNKIAQALVTLESKIESANLPRDSNWDDRIGEMLAAHIRLDPELPAAILAQPNLGAPGHTPLVRSFTENQLEQAIDKFVARINNDPDYQLTPDVARLLGRSQQPEIKNLLRDHADDYAIRSTILSILAATPEPQDRPLFVAGLDYDDVGILSELISALESLPTSNDPTEIVTLVRTLRRLASTPDQRKLQDALVRLLRSATTQSFDYQFDRPHSDPQADSINAWATWAEKTYPDHWSAQVTPPTLNDEQLKKLLATVNWQGGDPEKGKTLFEKRSCAQCHNGRSSLGPDLAGVTARFSRHDLYNAIFNPHRDVSPRYQTTLIATTDGRTHTGRVIYGSIDGLVFRTSTNQTLRINTPEIAAQRHLATSLMPTGLLNDLTPEDLAHLYAYLQTLSQLNK